MDTIRDMIASFLGAARDRLGHPLIGAFIIAWLIWNFRVVLVLVGDGPGWAEKIEYLDQRLMVSARAWLVHGVLLPLGFAAGWILVLPPVLRWFAVRHLEHAIKTKEAVAALQDRSPMSGLEVASFRARARKEREQWQEERAQLLKVIDEQQKASDGDLAQPPDDTTSVASLPLGSATKPLTPTFAAAASVDASSTRVRSEATIPFPDPIDEQDPPRRAGLLGLRFQPEGAKPSVDRARVMYYGNVLSWPWQLSEAAARSAKLPHAAGERISFDEEALAALFAIRQFKNDADPHAIAHVLKTEPFRATVAFDQLNELRFVEEGEDGFRITPGGRLFLAWLLRTGFEFNLPTKGS